MSSVPGMHEVVAHTLGGTAVLLANDNVLRHVDQTTSEVTRVGSVRRGVDQALTGAVGGNEVLERQKTLAEVCLNGKVDGARRTCRP